MFPLGSIVPPGLWLLAVHEVCNRNKNIQHAQIVFAAAYGAQPLVHGLRVLTGKIRWFVDAKQVQIRSHGLADVRQVSEYFNLFAGNLSRIHLLKANSFWRYFPAARIFSSKRRVAK